MIYHGIELCCPRCRGNLRIVGRGGSEIRCLSCRHRYPIILGIPDLRVFPDPYIDVDSDRAKGLAVAERMADVTFSELIDYYYRITPQVPPHHAAQYKRGIMSGVARSKTVLDSWERDLGMDEGQTSENFLEIGCGTGPMLVGASTRYAKVVGVDIAFRWLVVAWKRLQEENLDLPLVCACAEALPFSDHIFDVVASESTLEHVRDQEKSLDECHRVMQPGGRLYVSTPNRFSLGPDPQAGLWAGGWLPDRLLAAYVRRQGGIPPKRRLLSSGSLPRLIQGARFEAVRVLLTDIPEAQRSHFGAGARVLIGLYNLGKRLPFMRYLLLWIGPVLLATARRIQPEA